jgi:hypothetical protein
MLWGTKKKKERAELARGGDGVIGHAGIQTRTEDAEILTHNDGADARQIYFDHYICEAKPTSNLGAQKEETERGMNGREITVKISVSWRRESCCVVIASNPANPKRER